MKRCMETDKPLISILMAVYNPNLQWLEQQLLSVNNQTYENISVSILDDCSTEVSYEQICDSVRKCLNRFPYEISQNEINLGSTKTFERMTINAKGKYIAFCDQDDIWNNEKLTILVDLIEVNNALIVCSDVTIIDEKGDFIADSITKIRKRHAFYEGGNLGFGLLFKNFVIGCTMLVNSEIAKSAIPFADSMVHDHYLALVCSLKGKIEVYKRPLVNYRIHNSNQTNVMAGVNSKRDYYDKRIIPFCQRISEIMSRFDVNEIDKVMIWAEARKNYYSGNWKSAALIWKYGYMNKSTALFELIMLKMPSFFFKHIIKYIKAGKF